MTKEPHTILVIYINAEPDRIWRTITTREKSRAYFHETEIEPRIGGRFRLYNDQGEAITEGKVLIHDPPHRLRVSWKELSDPDSIPGEVDYLVEPVGGSTRLTVSNYDHPAPPPEYLDMGRKGWGFTLSSLKTLLETGKPLPPPER
jgi:uncharacterized protein YndB with AHSA1/START domain